MKPNRHHLRLDDATQTALNELCRLTLSTKSALMRRYIQEGISNEIKCRGDLQNDSLNRLLEGRLNPTFETICHYKKNGQ
jgi:hypothetical protein